MGRRSNYNIEIYEQLEETENKVYILTKEVKRLTLENKNLQYELNYLKESTNNKITTAVSNATTPLIDELKNVKSQLDISLDEITRLKNELSKKDYEVDKLECKVNKDSTNSGIPTSKEIINKHTKTGANTYNHREKSSNKSGGQFNHKGRTLTKEKLITKIKENNIKVKRITHYINGNSNKKDIVKYKIGLNVKLYVEEHIFKHTPKSEEKLPKNYYSDVTYKEDIKTLITTLGNYYSLGYSKVREILSDLSNGIIDISEGTIDNIYEEFSNKSIDTISNITNNILNGKYQHTDETTTSENGQDSYYRGYANANNVIYKYHHHKGDKPIEEDGILTNFFGTVISDHEVGIFKYGTNNQDCIYHIGRYCIEAKQNIYETTWQMKLYEFLLRCDRTRKIAMMFKIDKFEEKDIKLIEKEYDEILNQGKVENENIASTYWKERETALLNRLEKYKNCVLFYLHDFSVPCDNNFMERCLRMIKGKTKISGGFRSKKGGERFGNVMSIIKTAKLRKLNPLSCIKQIYEGNALFA